MDDDTRPTLDLCSAVQGNCHVTAMDDAEAKGLEGLDLEVPCDADAISQGASSTQSDDNMEVRAEKEGSIVCVCLLNSVITGWELFS